MKVGGVYLFIVKRAARQYGCVSTFVYEADPVPTFWSAGRAWLGMVWLNANASGTASGAWVNIDGSGVHAHSIPAVLTRARSSGNMLVLSRIWTAPVNNLDYVLAEITVVTLVFTYTRT